MLRLFSLFDDFHEGLPTVSEPFESLQSGDNDSFLLTQNILPQIGCLQMR